MVPGDQSPRGRPGVGEGAATALAREEKPRNRRLNESDTLNHACSQSLWLVFTWSNELKQGSDELTLAPLLGFRQCSPRHSTPPSPFLPHLQLFSQALPRRSSLFTRSWSQGSPTLHSPLHLSQSDVLHSRHLSDRTARPAYALGPDLRFGCCLLLPFTCVN